MSNGVFDPDPKPGRHVPGSGETDPNAGTFKRTARKALPYIGGIILLVSLIAVVRHFAG